MLVAEKRMLHIKVRSIKSSLSLIRAEMKLLKNCSKVLSDSGTGFKRSWGVVSYFSPFLVTSGGCLPGLADHSKGLARWVALSWKTCKQYSWVVCLFCFFFSLASGEFILLSSLPPWRQYKKDFQTEFGAWSDQIYSFRLSMATQP